MRKNEHLFYHTEGFLILFGYRMRFWRTHINETGTIEQPIERPQGRKRDRET